MIKAIIFDYGNIISSVDNNRFIEELSRATGKAGAELDQLICSSSDELRKYETGLITSDQFSQESDLGSRANFDLTLELFSSMDYAYQ